MSEPATYTIKELAHKQGPATRSPSGRLEPVSDGFNSLC